MLGKDIKKVAKAITFLLDLQLDVIIQINDDRATTISQGCINVVIKSSEEIQSSSDTYEVPADKFVETAKKIRSLAKHVDLSAVFSDYKVGLPTIDTYQCVGKPSGILLKNLLKDAFGQIRKEDDVFSATKYVTINATKNNLTVRWSGVYNSELFIGTALSNVEDLKTPMFIERASLKPFAKISQLFTGEPKAEWLCGDGKLALKLMFNEGIVYISTKYIKGFKIVPLPNKAGERAIYVDDGTGLNVDWEQYDIDLTDKKTVQLIANFDNEDAISIFEYEKTIVVEISDGTDIFRHYITKNKENVAE